MYPNWLLQRAFLTPSRVALSFEDDEWTFEQVNDIALKRAKQLIAAGVKPRSRVALLGHNDSRLLFIVYACMHLQCEMVMLNRRLSPAELAYQIEDSEAVVVLVDDEDVEKIPDASQMLVFSNIEQNKLDDFVPHREWSLSQTMTIMYTSGTTGFPKGVRQTVGNHQASATASALNIGLSEQDVWLCMMPLFHISGFSMFVKSLLYGNEVKLVRQFDEQQAAQHIVDGTVTHTSVVAVMLERILHHIEMKGQSASPKFKLVLAGGGSIPRDYIERAHHCGIAVSQTYGMTETASQSATLSNEDARRKIGSAGKPLFFNQIRIDCPNSQGEGEICIRGPHVTPGYIGKFANQQASIDGWLHTGDIGLMDEEGYLYIVDRRADLIISGGENVYPAEIENVLLAHPFVQEAGVCGIEDESWGQVPIAFIVKKSDVTTEQVLAYLDGKLARYKIPKALYFVDSLPRNGANKLLRRQLKELLK